MQVKKKQSRSVQNADMSSKIMKKESLLNSLKLLRRKEEEGHKQASVAEAVDVLIKCCEFLLKKTHEDKEEA